MATDSFEDRIEQIFREQTRLLFTAIGAFMIGFIMAAAFCLTLVMSR